MSTAEKPMHAAAPPKATKPQAAPAAPTSPAPPVAAAPAGLKLAAAVPGEPQVNVLFRTVMLHEASDLHLKAGLPGMMRLRGVVQRMATQVLTQEHMEKLLYPILTEKQRNDLEEKGG